MFRFLTFGKVKNIEHSYISKLSSGVKKNEPLATVGQPSSCRLFSWYTCSSKAHTSFNLYKAKEKLHTTSAQTFSGLSRHSTMTDYAQYAQKRFSQMYTYRGPAFQPINKRASMYSLPAVLSGYDTMKQLSQIACRRFSSMCSYRSVSTPLNRSLHMRPFSFSLSRHTSKKGHAQIAWKRFSPLRSDRGPASLLLNRSTHVLFRSSAVSYRKIMTHSARYTWKGSSQIRSYSGTIFVPSNRSIRAIILTLNKFYPVFSRILVFFIGTVAYTQRASADADEYLPVGNSLYMHAQDGHAYLTSIILSVLEGFVLLVRAIYLGFLFAPTIVMGPFADSFGVEFRKKWLHIVRVTLEKAGPAFIKWGQWAATRPDLFPRDLCVELSKLHSKAPEHSFAYTKKTIEKAFGRKLTEIFDDFEEAPVASGSVAQVHRATLRFQYPGKQDKPVVVAVKVRHPGVSESIRKDFVIIHFFAKISSFIPKLKWLRLDESVQQFAVFMMSQVDLSREAAQLSRFIYNFRKSKHVSFPRPLYPLVHPAVLVETYEKGESVSRYIDDNDELEGSDRIKRALADIGTNALLKMLLEDNFIHADMHPGNILVRVAQDKPDQKQLFKPKPHVIFLDVGMTAELSRTDQLNLREFFKAVAVRDGRTAAECTLRFSKKQNCPNPVAFIEEVEKSFTFWGTEEGDIVHPAECMHELLEQVRRHKVNIDGNVCTVMVTTLVLEGWQRKLDPDYNVMHTLQTLLFKADWVEDLVYTINELI